MVTEDQKRAWIQGSESFADAPVETVDELCAGFVERFCHAEELLIRQGERGGSLFIIIEGEFRVMISDKANPGGKRVAVLKAGDVCGEIGAVSGIEATATVQALSNGRVLELGEKRFHEVMYHSPRLAETVLRSMLRYL